MATLQCHSRGNLGFSPFGAEIKLGGVIDTIENIYQTSKVFEDGTQSNNWRNAKGKKAVSYKINGAVIDNNSKQVGIDILTSLWVMYLEQNQIRMYELGLYNEFEDIFDRGSPLSQESILRRIRYEGIAEVKSGVIETYNKILGVK